MTTTSSSIILEITTDKHPFHVDRSILTSAASTTSLPQGPSTTTTTTTPTRTLKTLSSSLSTNSSSSSLSNNDNDDAQEIDYMNELVVKDSPLSISQWHDFCNALDAPLQGVSHLLRGIKIYGYSGVVVWLLCWTISCVFYIKSVKQQHNVEAQPSGENNYDDDAYYTTDDDYTNDNDPSDNNNSNSNDNNNDTVLQYFFLIIAATPLFIISIMILVCILYYKVQQAVVQMERICHEYTQQYEPLVTFHLRHIGHELYHPGADTTTATTTTATATDETTTTIQNNNNSSNHDLYQGLSNRYIEVVIHRDPESTYAHL